MEYQYIIIILCALTLALCAVLAAMVVRLARAQRILKRIPRFFTTVSYTHLGNAASAGSSASHSIARVASNSSSNVRASNRPISSITLSLQRNHMFARNPSSRLPSNRAPPFDACTAFMPKRWV